MSNTPLNFNQASVRANELVANQRLGIGTHTQTATIHAKAAAADFVLEDGVTNGQATQTAFRVLADGGKTHFQCGTSTGVGTVGDFTFQNYGGTTTSMTIVGSTGNVGINTSPADNLHVRDSRGNETPATIILQPSSNLYNRGYAKIEGFHDASLGAGAGLRFYTRQDSGSDFDVDSLVYERMRISSAGNVGIGTDTPIAKFHVNGVDGRIWGLPVRSFADDYALTYNATAYYGDPSVSIWASGKIFAGDVIGSVGGTITASDERIKTNITDINDGDALATLRLLKPKKYQYKDTIKRGTEPVWGFIAQEVANTLPYSTQTTINTLPNIYEMANVSDSNVITFTNFDTSSLESNASVIKVNAKDGTDHLVKLVEVINEHTIRVKEDLSEWIGSVDETGNVVAGNQLFIYGQEVDDFVYLKKDAIWTVATAALQEVDRQLQAEKAKLTSVLARLDALENANG